MLVSLYEKNGVCYVKLYEVEPDRSLTVREWNIPRDAMQRSILIPLHEEPYGFVIAGKECFYRVREGNTRKKPLGFFNIKAYGRFFTEAKKQSYLIGDHNGNLVMLEVTNLTLRKLGRTSVASSISCISDTVVFVGSSSTDSQIIKIQHTMSDLQVLHRFANLGPITDFAVINKPGGRRKILLGCGNHENGLIEVLRAGIGIIPQETVEASDVVNVWSLKSYMFDAQDTYLVIQTMPGYVISVYVREENGFRYEPGSSLGLSSGSITFCCREVTYKQIIQVNSESVRLIDSKTGELRNLWTGESKITRASATCTQVLLAVRKQLIYFEIGDGELMKLKNIHRDHDIACLDISPLHQTSYQSTLAAVATWTEKKIQIFSLPMLDLLAQEQLHSPPRCILVCTFGVGSSYIFCASSDGNLYSFKLNLEDFQLHERSCVSLGSTSFTLRKFTSNGEVFVFFSTVGVPTIIFLKEKKLQHENMNLSDVFDICPFHTELTGESLVIGSQDGITFCTLGEIVDSGTIPMTHFGRQICYQGETNTYAMIAEEKQPTVSHMILLLDDDHNTTSVYKLVQQEVGLCIINCQFSEYAGDYFCVGTSQRILVLRNLNGKLVSPYDELITNGDVRFLKNVRGGILANIGNGAPRFYELVQTADGHELSLKDEIVNMDNAEEKFSRVYSLSQHVRYDDLTDLVIAPENRSKHTAVAMTENEVLFASDARRIITSMIGFNGKAVGRWHSGEFVTQIKAGSLSRLSDMDYAQVPSMVFSTASGAVGVIVSLPPDVYDLLERFERNMRLRAKGLDGFNDHKCIGLDSSRAANFIDGDYIESFLTLTTEEQKEISSRMETPYPTLSEIIHYVSLFR